MSQFPHVYTTTAKGTNDTVLKLSSESLPPLDVSPPPQFGGPKGYWNPEAFFSAAISSCFILTFKSVTGFMKLAWEEIEVDVDAYLDKTGSKLSFTKVEIFVSLMLKSAEDEEKARKALEKSKDNCLVTNSINSQIHLSVKIESELVNA